MKTWIKATISGVLFGGVPSLIGSLVLHSYTWAIVLPAMTLTALAAGMLWDEV